MSLIWGNMVFYRVKKVKGNYYLIKEWYDPITGKKKLKCLGDYDN